LAPFRNNMGALLLPTACGRRDVAVYLREIPHTLSNSPNQFPKPHGDSVVLSSALSPWQKPPHNLAVKSARVSPHRFQRSSPASSAWHCSTLSITVPSMETILSQRSVAVTGSMHAIVVMGRAPGPPLDKLLIFELH
jgi:hypothetical protein